MRETVALVAAREFGQLAEGAGEDVGDRQGLEQRAHRHAGEVHVGDAETDDELTVEIAGVTLEAVEADDLLAALGRVHGPVVGDLRVLAAAAGQRIAAREVAEGDNLSWWSARPGR